MNGELYYSYVYVTENFSELVELTIEHLQITGAAMGLAILLGVPLGIILTRFKVIDSIIIGVVGILQTIPSLALLSIMLPLFGIGFKPAVVALFLYALLPIVRNSYVGVNEVTSDLVRAAKGMGMSRLQILLKVQVPIALPVIISGVRTSTVICVGTTTLAALIGAGGLGSLIYRGLQQFRNDYIITGAFFSALLALTMDYGLGFIKMLITSEGIQYSE